jgi:ATP-dependent DNA ligase
MGMGIPHDIEVMLARPSDHLPIGEYLIYQPKWDGWRCVASCDEHGAVALRSRRGSRLDTFPEVVNAVFDAVPAGTVLDGELVRWADGRLDFNAVGRRFTAGPVKAWQLAAREPLHYVIFDLLFLAGQDLRDRPLAERRRYLEELMHGVPPAGVLTLTPETSDVAVAREWMQTLPAAGLEGVVAKDLRGRYQGATRGWVKYKARTAEDGIVGAIVGRNLARPDRLVLGRHDTRGQFVVTASTLALKSEESTTVGSHLKRPGPDHPWPFDSIISTWGRAPTPITRVHPDLVVEVSVDTAMIGTHRHRHLARLIRPRLDLDPTNLPAVD